MTNAIKTTTLLALSLVLCGGCEVVLSIEDARVDPRLGQDGGDGSAGTSAGAGNDATPSNADADVGIDMDATGSDPRHGDATTGDAAEGDAADGSGEVPPSALCTEYCDVVMSNCTERFAVYTDRDVCLAYCGHLPRGTAGDESGNSVHCRLTAAHKAPSEAPYYCPVAGPGGNGTCGSNCESLCHVADSACSGEHGRWATADQCLEDCSALPDLGTYSAAPSEEQYSGGHVQCRLYHLSAATAEDPNLHCGHAAGDPPCNAID